MNVRIKCFAPLQLLTIFTFSDDLLTIFTSFQSALAPPPSLSVSAWRQIEQSAARLLTNRPWLHWNVRPTSRNWSGRQRPNVSSWKYIRKVPQNHVHLYAKWPDFCTFLETAAKIGDFAVYRPRSQLRALLCAQTSRFHARLQLQQRRHHHHHHNSNDDDGFDDNQQP